MKMKNFLITLKIRIWEPKKTKATRILVLMDATGSMESLLRKTQNAVGTMFERALTNSYLKRLVTPKSFELQCAVYRDYDQGVDGIL
jgi:uncharacterized protein with von Willebrand factor type A (vWA) domain